MKKYFLIFAILSIFESNGMTMDVKEENSSDPDSMINSGIKNRYLYNELYNFNTDTLQIPVDDFFIFANIALINENDDHYLITFSSPQMATKKYVGYTVINNITFVIHVVDSTYYYKLIDTSKLTKGLPQHIFDKLKEENMWNECDPAGKKYKIHNQDSIKFVGIHYI